MTKTGVIEMDDEEVDKRVIRALKRLRRENGSHCLFPLKLICSCVKVDPQQTQTSLDRLAQYGEVFKSLNDYRLI